jgi:cystathionine beta-lyase/cystathionine gamma-synthase
MIDVFEGVRPGYVYTRYDNPTLGVVEEKIAALENGGFGLLFSSGLAALHAVLWSELRSGDHVVVGRDIYGGTGALLGRVLPRLGVTWASVDLADPGAYEAALSARPRLVLFETPTNPLVRVLDGAAIVERAHAAGARAVIDNTFATPILQNPLGWGADLVVHSATKYLGGHSDVVLGAVVGTTGEERTGIETARRTLGAVPDPFAAWLLNRGLATLAIRVQTQSATALRLANHLVSHPAVERVHYPGVEGDPGHGLALRQMRASGGVFSFVVPGGREGAVRLLGGLELIRLATSLGGVETLASHPATSSHQMLAAADREALGIGEGLVRIAVGLEDAGDLWADLDAALKDLR